MNLCLTVSCQAKNQSKLWWFCLLLMVWVFWVILTCSDSRDFMVCTAGCWSSIVSCSVGGHSLVPYFQELIGWLVCQGFWRGNVPALLLVMPYTAIQFVVLQNFKSLVSGSTEEGQHLLCATCVDKDITDFHSINKVHIGSYKLS